MCGVMNSEFGRAQLQRRLPSGQRFLIRGAKHEIYMSTDDVLFPWWHQVLEFLKR